MTTPTPSGGKKESSTERFLRLLNKQNESIAAQAAEREAAIQAAKGTPDELRLQRDAERREQWGQLRARSHNGSRPKRISRVGPYIDLTGPND